MSDNSKRTGPAVEAHYQFLTWLMPTVEKFPRTHKFTIGDRIEIAALDVLEALIEATYSRDRLQHLQQANLGIEKLRFLLRTRGRPVIGCAAFATNGGQEPSGSAMSIRAWWPGSLTPGMQIRGTCAMRSSGAAGSIRPTPLKPGQPLMK